MFSYRKNSKLRSEVDCIALGKTLSHLKVKVVESIGKKMVTPRKHDIMDIFAS